LSGIEYEARKSPREGDERLSGGHQGESQRAAKRKDSGVDGGGEKKGRKQRSAEVGRALRTVYDDTLRENVPDDFHDLLGKLS
jgi:hypothetical protein